MLSPTVAEIRIPDASGRGTVRGSCFGQELDFWNGFLHRLYPRLPLSWRIAFWRGAIAKIKRTTAKICNDGTHRSVMAIGSNRSEFLKNIVSFQKPDIPAPCSICYYWLSPNISRCAASMLQRQRYDVAHDP